MNGKQNFKKNLALPIVTLPTPEQAKGILELIDLAAISEHGLNERAADGISYLARLLKRTYPDNEGSGDPAGPSVG